MKPNELQPQQKTPDLNKYNTEKKITQVTQH